MDGESLTSKKSFTDLQPTDYRSKFLPSQHNLFDNYNSNKHSITISDNDENAQLKQLLTEWKL